MYTFNESVDKSPTKNMNYLSEMSLNSGLTAVYKLSQSITLLPTTTASVERSYSSLKIIHTYCRSTKNTGKDEQFKYYIDRNRIGIQVKISLE